MAEQVVTITGVFEKSGESAKGSWTRYDVKTSGGTRFQTFDDALGSRAKNFKGRPAKIQYDEEPRGEYVNNTIKLITPLEESERPAPSSAPANSSSSFAPEDDRQLRIMRQSALERAILVYGLPGWDLTDPTDLYELADEFLRYFQEGQQAPVEAVETVKL